MDRASLARQIKIHVEDSTDTLLKQLKFERRRNDSLERENDHLGNVEWFKSFLLIAVSVIIGELLYHSIGLILWPL